MPKIFAAKPDFFEPQEIDDFVALAVAGGEVAKDGLRGRVLGASHIAFLRERECLIGVGGLKHPSGNYRHRVEASAQIDLRVVNVPYELGWVFIMPSARGKGYSLLLCRQLVAAASERGIFATSRLDNDSMHRTLERLSFVRCGKAWASQQNDGDLVLFVKYPHPHSMKASPMSLNMES